MANTFTAGWIVTSCNSCHCYFGITTEMRADLINSGETFYCPRGHVLTYGHGLIKQLEKKVSQLNIESVKHETEKTKIQDQLDHQIRSNNSLKGQITKLKKKVKK